MLSILWLQKKYREKMLKPNRIVVSVPM